MKCGEISGHMTKQGKLCAFNIRGEAKGCTWYRKGPKGRSLLASKGPAARRKRKLFHEDYVVPPFDELDSLAEFDRYLAQQVLTTNADPRRVDSAIRASGEARAVIVAKKQASILDALLRLEHGEAAMLLFARLQDGMKQGPRRPLPGRVVTIPQGEAS